MEKLFVITGATGGMGYEASLHFSKMGRLLLLDINEDKLKELSKELGDHTDYMKFDITNSDDLNNLNEKVKSLGGFNNLLHFAGVSESMGNSELIYKINLLGTKNLLDTLYEHILPGGVVINISSITAHTTPLKDRVLELVNEMDQKDFLKELVNLTESTTEAYGWSKFGVMNLTKKQGMRWGMKKARIVSISPGAIKTPMVEKEMEKNADGINQVIKMTPAGRIGEAIDIINLVDFLVSDKASFITGVDILIDGGVTEVFKGFSNK